MAEDLRERDGLDPLKEGSIGSSLYKCKAVASKGSVWMKEKVSIYQCSKTKQYYFRLSGDLRSRNSKELLDV